MGSTVNLKNKLIDKEFINLLRYHLRITATVVATIVQGSAVANDHVDQVVFRVLTAGSPGSAFIVGPAENGKCLLLTAYHVIGGNTPTEPVTFISPRRKKFDLYRTNFIYDEALDIAFSPVPNCIDSLGIALAKASAISISTKVLIKGYPADEESISRDQKQPHTAIGRITQYSDNIGYDLSYDAPTMPGLSGGPAINADGSELMAIHGRTDTVRDNTDLETRERFRLGGRGISAPQIFRFMKEKGYILPRSDKITCIAGVC